jgi:DNA replication protein DnaC
MHIEQTLYQMRQMRLSYMARSLEERLKNGDHRELSHEEFIALIVEDEFSSRRNRKLTRMLNRANFKSEQACIENIKYSSVRNFKKADIMPFTSETWIANAQNLIITGKTGTGKTYLAEAIGRRACILEYQAVKIRYSRLFDEIHEARGTGTYPKYIDKLDKIKVLILDDFANGDVSKKDLSDLVDIIEERDQKWPMIVTSQYKVADWHKRFPDPTFADAICDRLVHGSVKLNLEGPSMRKMRDKSGSK